MPELNLNYAPTPPWLEKTPGDATAGFLDSVKSVLAIKEAKAAMPLKLRAMQQEAEMNQLKQSELVRNRDQLLEAELAAQGLGDRIGPLFEAGKPFDAMKALLSEGMRNPLLFKSPQWQTMMKGAAAAVDIDTKLKQLESMDKLRQSQIEENKAQANALAEGVTPEIRQVTDPATGKPVSLIRTGPNSWREARGGGNIDPGEAARIQLSLENFVARYRAGQLDEKKFQLSILEKIQEIETAPLLGVKPADQPAERAKRKAELLRQMRTMGITTEFVEPAGLRQSIQGQLAPPAAVPGSTAPTPAPTVAPAPPTIWVPDFKSGRLIPKE